MNRTNRSTDGGSAAGNGAASANEASFRGGDRLVADGGRDRSGSGEGDQRPDDGGDREEERRRKRRAAVRPHESASERVGEPDDARGEPGSGDQWSPPGVDPDQVPWYFSPVSVDEPDPPPIVDRLGSVGIYLALAALVLAVVGVGAAGVGIQPFGNAAITLSLGLGLVAMAFGMVFQAVASDFLSRSE